MFLVRINDRVIAGFAGFDAAYAYAKRIKEHYGLAGVNVGTQREGKQINEWADYR